ncbi:MAG: PAS domain S-box protein [Bacteroidota bacterium]
MLPGIVVVIFFQLLKSVYLFATLTPMPRKKTKAKPARKSAAQKKATAKKSPAPKVSLHKKLVAKLKESERQLKIILKAARVGIWEWDVRRNKVSWSPSMNKIYNLPPYFASGTFEGFLQVVHPDDQKRITITLENALKHDNGYHIEHRIVWRDGTVHWVEAFGTVVRNKKGKPVKMAGTVQDITAKKNIEIDRQDWKTRHEIVAASAGLVIYDYDIPSGDIQWSGNCYEVLGYKSEELGNIDRWVDLIHPDDRDEAFRELELAQQELQRYDVYYRFQTKKGNYCYMHDRGMFIADEQGHAKRMLGMMNDVSERLAAERTIQESNLFKESVENAMPGILFVFDIRKEKNVYLNRKLETYLGYLPNEINTEQEGFFRTIVHPEDLQSFPVWTNEPSTTVQEIEYRMKTKKGEWRWFLSRSVPFHYDEQGNVTQIVGITQDINERKEAVELLNKSDRSYRELFNSVGEALYIQDPDGTFIDVNTAACRMYGYDKREMVGKKPDFLSADGKNSPEKLEEVFGKALEGQPQTFEWWGKKKTGEVFLKEVSLTRSTYFGKEAIIAAAWDITEIRSSVEALRDSEKRFRNLIRNLNVGILLYGPHADFILSNKTALNLLGLSEDELSGKQPFHPEWNVTHEDGTDFPEETRPLRQAITTLKPVRGVMMGVYRPSKKDRMWLLVNAEPILDEHKKLVEVICTYTDITHRREIEERLKDSEHRFRILQEASFGGIGLHDQGVIADCNQGLSDITGYSYDELIGQNGVKLLIAPEWQHVVIEKIKTRYEKPYDVQGIRKDGTRYFLEIHAKEIPYEGKVIRVTEFRDITERKLAEEQIIDQNTRLLAVTEDLKRKNNQLEEFTHIVSHNLRSPVGNIVTLLSFYEGTLSEEEKQEYFKLLKQSSSTTLSMLNDLNEVLQIKQNKNIEKHDLQFETVFHQVRSMLNAKITESSAEVTYNFSKARTIHYPRIYLESVMLNLLSNALKYSHPERKPLIHFSTHEQDGNTMLEVKDNGLGINLDKYGHQIFKLRKTFHRHPESRGIGLFMIKNQIEAMGGEITISSEENVGTTFFVNFNKHLTDGL